MTRKSALLPLLLLLIGSLSAAAPRRVFLRVIVTADRTTADAALEALRKGESFPEVARRLSIHASSSQGGYLGETWTARLNADWAKAVGVLEWGRFSEPVPFGNEWAILYRMPRRFKEKAYRLQAEGDAKMGQGLVDEAIALYKGSVAEYPEFIHGFFLLGVAYRKKGDLDREIEAYRNAVSIEPNYDLGFYNLGLALIREGKLLDAIVALRRAVEIKPDYTDCYTSLSAVYLQLGRLDDAVATAKAAVRANPLRPEGYYNLGAAESRTGSSQAVDNLETAVVLDSGRPEFRMALAIGQAQANRLDQAVATLEELVRLRPDFSPARQLLERLREATRR